MVEEKFGFIYNMNSTCFESNMYLEKLLRECTLKQIMDTEAAVVKDTQTLHSDMQTLVYENYNKFISATETIRKMKSDFKKMESDMDLLKNKMETITMCSEEITDTLEESRSQLCNLSEKHSLLKRLQFLSALPAKLKTFISRKSYTQAVQDYLHAQKVFVQYGNQPSFQGIQTDCEVIIEDLKHKLRKDFQLSNTAQSLTEIGELLIQLNDNPSNLAKDMLKTGSIRLLEQINIIQDQGGKDIIEFIDLGIEGFLNDLTLVVISYYEMFIIKKLETERDDFKFKEVAEYELNDFMNHNIVKYLNLVQERVLIEIGFGESKIILQGLDRLHRRLLAMKNICRGVEVKRNAIEIIISAAHQLCDIHSKKLKDSFAENLIFVRISLLSMNSENFPNLTDLISTVYLSTIEKVKGVLQDLLVFFESNWSFNIKMDFKGSLCVEGIRENLLIKFLRHICQLMNSFGHLKSSIPVYFLLVLSKVCSEMEQSGVHSLILMVDDLYDIDSDQSTTLTHEAEIIAEMRDTTQNLLDAFVRYQGSYLSQVFRKSVESRDWLNCLEPRSVRAVMQRVIVEITNIETVVANLYVSGTRTATSSDSSKKTNFGNITSSKQHYRSNWSNYTSSHIEPGYACNIHKLFSERVEIFESVEFSKVSIVTGIIKIGLKTFLECVRLQTFSKFGLQQVQVDTHFLQIHLWNFVADENLVNFLLDEILGSCVHRCLESILMEPNAVEIICERS